MAYGGYHGFVGIRGISVHTYMQTYGGYHGFVSIRWNMCTHIYTDIRGLSGFCTLCALYRGIDKNQPSLCTWWYIVPTPSLSYFS